MTRGKVCAAARRIVHWHARFAPLFGRKEARAHSFDYVRELMADQERKSVEAGRQTVQRLEGKLIMADVITRPHPELAALLPA